MPGILRGVSLTVDSDVFPGERIVHSVQSDAPCHAGPLSHLTEAANVRGRATDRDVMHGDYQRSP